MPHNATFHQDLQYSLRENRISKIFLIKVAFLSQKLEKNKAETPWYRQWTIPSVLHQARRKSPLVHKGLKKYRISWHQLQYQRKKKLQEHKMALFPTFFLAKLVMSTNVEPSGPEVVKLFSCSTQLSMKFIMLINVKMPTIEMLAF